MQFINVFIKDFQGRACFYLLFVLFITLLCLLYMHRWGDCGVSARGGVKCIVRSFYVGLFYINYVYGNEWKTTKKQ